MNLYNEFVNLITQILFTDTNGVITITEWQQQIIEFVTLPIVFMLVACVVGLIWKCLTSPFWFFK